MIASRTELEQMVKDGKGRASVVRALAQIALNRKNWELLDAHNQVILAQQIELMVSEWPNTLEEIFTEAKNMTKFEGVPEKWWRKFRNNLPAAAKKVAGME